VFERKDKQLEIQGQIEEIIYQNEVNGYTVAELDVDGELLTAVGYLPFINKGDTLKLIGKFVEHQEYGTQFKIDTFEKLIPETEEALEKYLSGGIIKGVGPATSKRIVDYFGTETLAILRFSPEKLSQIKGITKEKAIEIGEEFNEKWELWQIVSFLERFGITAGNSKKVYDELGSLAIEKIEKNPYILLDITYGVDFQKIDKMALDIGISYNDERRIKSTIKYSLLLSSGNGHTCVIKENLIQFVIDMIDVTTEEIENSLISLKVGNEVIEEERDGETWLFLQMFFECEKAICEKLTALRNSKNVKKIKSFKEEMEKTEVQEGIKLSSMQVDAIELVNNNNVCVITRRSWYW